MDINCSICWNGIFSNDGRVVATKCGHVFHFNCLNHWRAKNNACPECRSNISDLRNIYLNNTSNFDAMNLTIVKNHMKIQEEFLKTQESLESEIKKLKNGNKYLNCKINRLNDEKAHLQSEYDALIITNQEIIEDAMKMKSPMPKYYLCEDCINEIAINNCNN